MTSVLAPRHQPVRDGIILAMKSVLIVDDHDGFRTWLRRFVDDLGAAVVGEARTGNEALELMKLLKPEVVLLDIQLPDSTGFDVAQDSASLDETPDIVFISTRPASSYGRDMGANVFVAKPDISRSTLGIPLGLDE